MPTSGRSLYSPTQIFKIVLLLVMLHQVESIYSPYYKRCRIHKGAIDADAVAIEDLEIEIIPNYPEKHMSHPIITPELQINYIDFDFYFHEFIDAGGSGEVYLVEDAKTGQGKILKRYFKERPQDFRRENYLMKQLNYSMQWTKSCKGVQKCTEEDTDFNTVSIFPHKQTIVFKTLEFDGKEAPLIFYKILKEMDKIHRAGIIHNDIKMGNILVNSMGLNFKFYEIQIIDWNLAMFYYTGLDDNSKRGTVCYYSPQELLRTQYPTPARDIWALGIAMFAYFTNEKPFATDCKVNNLKTIVTLTGGKKILELNKKYNYNSMEQMRLLKQFQANPEEYPERDLAAYPVEEEFKQFFTKDLVNVFKRMLVVDPEKRATAAELLQMKYFRHLNILPDMYQEKEKKKKERENKTPKSKKTKQTKTVKTVKTQP